MVLVRVLCEEPGVPLVRDDEADPHDHVHDQEGVVGAREHVPRHGHALLVVNITLLLRKLGNKCVNERPLSENYKTTPKKTFVEKNAKKYKRHG